MRKISSPLLSVLLVTVLVLQATTGEAHAYIDPGSGSFLLQMLLASIFASLFALKVFWHRFTSKMSSLFAKFKGSDKSREVEP